MTVKYSSFSGTCYEYHDIIELKDFPELNFFILKSPTDEFHIPKYSDLELIIQYD